MTAIFHDMMHQELEDYVDDIVVKSRKREEHFHVLKRVFERCREFKLRMNPLKCAFMPLRSAITIALGVTTSVAIFGSP